MKRPDIVLARINKALGRVFVTVPVEACLIPTAVRIGTCKIAGWPISPPLGSEGSMTLNMFGVELLPLVEAQHLNFGLGDLGWAGSTSQPEFSDSTEPYPEVLAVASPAPASNSPMENSLGTALPANWGVHILTLLSKNRDEPGENNSAASASGTASQAKAAQAQSQAVHQAQQPDKASKQREKNKRAQKRHRDRQKVVLCMLYPSSNCAVSDTL